MDFKDLIKSHAEQILKIKENICTEEATKTAMIMPFLQVLGYNVFNPLEVIPEFTADVASRKGEKIDYCIKIDGGEAMLIECKNWTEKLESYRGQLQRYFTCTEAGVGVLTNGIIYEFYTDLQKPNIMDDTPFLRVDLSDLNQNSIKELHKFHKSNFDYSAVQRSASELWYRQMFRETLTKELEQPSIDFIKFLLQRIFAGQDVRITSKFIEQTTPAAVKAFSQYIEEAVSSRLKKALISNETTGDPTIRESTEITEVVASSDNGIVTTQDEIDSFQIIKNICRQVISDVSRISFKDYKSYSVVTIDKDSKWFVRLYMGTGKKSYISFLNTDGKGERDKIQLNSLNEIYNYSEKIIESLKIAM